MGVYGSGDRHLGFVVGLRFAVSAVEFRFQGSGFGVELGLELRI